MFFAINLSGRIRADHPLRPIKRVVDAILNEMAGLFESAYSTTGRPSVPPERLLKALLLQSLRAPQRGATGGAARYRPAFPLVLRYGSG